MSIGIGITFAVISIALFVWLLITIYTAFIGKKDERMKMIVMKSMAQSFAVLPAIHTLHFILRISLGASYAAWRDNLTTGIHIDPMAQCLIILGVFMFVNKRVFGSKSRTE